MKRLQVATVFSGIGAPEQALEKLNVDYNIVFACDNGERELKIEREEIVANAESLNLDVNEYVKTLYDNLPTPNYMKQSYFANYDISEDRWFEDIRFIDGNVYKNKVDLLVGGSPCQSFSIIGKRAGLDDARGTLFYEYARLIDEIKPKFFIYENVLGMLTHDKGNTWKHIKEIFESLGYNINVNILNSVDYGIPQNRKRLFVIGFKDKNVKYVTPKPIELTTEMADYLEEKVETKHYLGKKGFEFVTNPKYKNRARVNSKIIQTQKANQQFNWNGDFVFEELEKVQDNEEIMARAYVGNWEGKDGVVRQLSYRECLRLMGFSDSFKVVVPNVPAYRQIGNSIVVDVLVAIFKSSFKAIDEANGSKKKNKVKLATVFSGIGAIEQAFKRLHIDHEIVFACDNGEIIIDYDVDEEKKKVCSLANAKEKREYVENLYNSKSRKTNYVKESYMANYGDLLRDDNFFQDIRLLDGKDFEDEVDILVGGSPCQSFSTVGFQGGLEDTRGTLFYDYANLIKDVNPKVFIYENVRGLTTHDSGKTWAIMKNVFDELGYKIYESVLDAKEYGIPQTRRRLYVVGIREDLEGFDQLKFPPEKKELKYTMQDFLLSACEEGGFSYSDNGDLVLSDVPGTYDKKYILSPKLEKYVMKTGTKTFVQRVGIDLPVARTLLSTMGNRHRAGVDNYISTDTGLKDEATMKTYGNDRKEYIRMLAEREAHRLMGFTDDYKIVVSRAQAYKQAGNSIVVDVLMEILKNIMALDVL